MGKKQTCLILILFIFFATHPLSWGKPVIDPPHEGASCNDCHGGGWSALYDTTPRCLGCHSSGGMAKNKPFALNDASRLFNFSTHDGSAGQQTSHAWGVPLEEAKAGASQPPEKAGSYVSDRSRNLGKISCPSCHSGHENRNRAMLRGPYDSHLDDKGDMVYGVNELCFECHSINETWGIHPVKVTLPRGRAGYNYPPAVNPAFAAISSSTLKLYSTPEGPGRVLCLTCHGVHASDSNPYTEDRLHFGNLSTGDGYLLRQYNDSGLCLGCHNYPSHRGMTCRNCHDPHPARGNRALVMSNISTPEINSHNFGNVSVSLKNPSSGYVFFSDSGPRGICESCHSLATDSLSGPLFQGWSSNHAALGIAKSEAPFVNCIQCHGHKPGGGIESFSSCDNCDSGDVIFQTQTVNVCEDCHFGAGDVDDYTYGNGKAAIISQGQYTTTGHGRRFLSQFSSGNYGPDFPCLRCHEGNAPHGDPANPFMLITTVNADPDVLCLKCHGHDSSTEVMLFATMGEGGVECFACHLPTQVMPSTLDWRLNTHSHGGMAAAGGYQNHTSWRITPKCIDCHDPHGDSNMTMIHDKVHTGGSDEYGRPEPFFNKSTVVFTSHSGPGSFATNEETSVCQACHSKTNHFRQVGLNGASDPNHSNVGGAVGKKCTEACHIHQGGFAHGVTGEGGGNVCVNCHGHEAGTEIDRDMSYPWTGGSGEYSQGRGTTTPHSTHTESFIPGTAGDDDRRGPGIYCNSCHDITNIPAFKSGTDANGDGRINLAETDVCDDCHSPGGDYNGINSIAGSVGAKDNWHTGGVYNSDGSLKPGKEKWCAGCHDKAPSVIANMDGVVAPNVIGDEDGDYKYGTGWGFYKTGHGLTDTEFIPSGGTVKAGPGRNCPDCHNTMLSHIDGNARTFDCSDGCDPAEYQESYRLKRIDGAYPMYIPLPQNTTPKMSTSYFRLCFSCHTDNKRFVGPKVLFYEGNEDDPFWNTNMVTEGLIVDDPDPLLDVYGPVNRHYYHLAEMNTKVWPADYDLANKNSRPTCISCHNVHGSTNLAMVRDGKLIDSEPGLRIWYNNPDIVTISMSRPPIPENVPLTSSTGTYWERGSSANLCSHCHGWWDIETRVPYQDLTLQAPVLTWTGENMFTNDGVSPDAGPAAGSFEFRVKYRDSNNQAPGVIQVWIDRNDDGDYLDAVEAITLTAVSDNDDNYYDGKLYAATISDLRKLPGPGDNILKYRFYASDPDGNDAIGEATGDSTLYLTNGIPTLAWTGETNYIEDGANPDYGADGAVYEFRINYIDTDAGECPPGVGDIQVWIDADDSGAYEGGEKHNMIAVDGGDSDCTDGKLYTYTTTLSRGVTDGNLTYRFYGFDGTDQAAGDPVIDGVVSVSASANNPPLLAHVDGACRTDGVAPAIGPAGGDFTFTVNYADGDNVAPVAIQVWIDKNDNNNYLDAQEKLDLTEVDADDTNYADGKLYRLIVSSIPYAGDGDLKYRFYAADAAEDAVGIPTQEKTLTVVNGALKVRPAGGAGWYSTIQSAVNASTDPSTILVYPKSDFSAYSYTERVNIEVKHNLTLKSVCGADLTAIDASTLAYAVYYRDSNTGTVEGFTLTGAADAGLYTMRGSDLTLRNSKVHSNNRGIFSNDGVNLLIEDTEIYSNTLRGYQNADGGSSTTFRNIDIHSHNAGANNGAGMYLNYGVHVIENSSIHDNTSATLGGGVYILGPFAGTGFTNTIFTNNRADTGGAVYHQSGGATTYVNVTFADNYASNLGGAVGINNNFNGEFRNSIFWNNRAANDAHNIYKAFGGSIGGISNSNIDTAIDYVNRFVQVTYADNITPAVDPFFVDAAKGDYHIVPNSPMVDQASADYAPADDYDGDIRPQGAADDIGADEVATDSGPVNDPPVLSWTGETNYVVNGINPDAAYSDDTFEFRVDYTDANDAPPQTIQVWIDLNKDGAYGDGEKFDMDEDNAGDTTYDDGKRYFRPLILTYAGGGDFNYRFYANDGVDEAMGTPTLPNTVSVLNNVPTIDWTGEANYIADGVHPDSGVGGDNFVFRVDYRDLDNSLPNPIEVWIDLDDSGSYGPGEKYAMSVVGGGSSAPYDGDFTNGERYAVAIQVPYVGDGVISYRISASDGVDDATGTAHSDQELSVTKPVNDKATLTWITEDCRTGGARPAITAAGVDVGFAVIYRDPDNLAPGTIQVWVDENDDGSYGSSEKYNMTVDGGDGDYTNGEVYRVHVPLTLAGDNILNYRIYATDGVEEAVGVAADGSTIEVKGGIKVRPEGGAGWETIIQTAVDSSFESDHILVYPYADFTATAYEENLRIGGKSNMTIQSVCGPDLTTISGGGSTAILIGASNYVVLDGFAVTSPAGTAVYVNQGGNITLKNNKLLGSAYGIYANNGANPVNVENNKIYSNSIQGIHSNAGTTSLAITGSEIYSNTVGVLFNGGIHTIADSIVRNNTSGGDGGGLYVNATNSVTVTNTIIKDNTAVARGGGVYVGNGGSINFYRSVLKGNVSSGGAGGAVYLNSLAPSVSFENCFITNNSALTGGAVGTNFGTTSFINTTLADNQATTGAGGAFYSCNSNDNIFRNTIFWNNSAAGLGDNAYKGCGASAFLTVTDSNISTGAGFISGGSLTTDGSNMDPAQDPRFVGGGDYHLQSGSPVIDQANASYAPADDIDGDSRPLGSADDIGADEYVQ